MSAMPARSARIRVLEIIRIRAHRRKPAFMVAKSFFKIHDRRWAVERIESPA
jgi:hypothetical protein